MRIFERLFEGCIDVRRELGWDDVELIDVDVQCNKQPHKGNEYKSLKELFKDYSGDYKCQEWDTGEKRGKEVW